MGDGCERDNMMGNEGFNSEQRGVILASLKAMIISALVLVVGYLWLPAAAFGLDAPLDAGERIAFALKADLLLLIWLAGCVKAVSGGRFRSPADIRGSAYALPSPTIAVRVAVLQNSLEQTLLAFGAHLALASVLRGPELVLIPLLVGLFLAGRIKFAMGYSKGAAGRAFGMALTAVPIVFALLLGISLAVAGR